MKILMCCHLLLDARLGGAKVYIENAQSYRNLGHDVDLFGAKAIGDGKEDESFSNQLYKFIKNKINDYDVVEYEYFFLPFDRTEFPEDKLLVARSVLLQHHLLDFTLPNFKGFRGLIGEIFKKKKRSKDFQQIIKQADLTLKNCDLISVPNPSDKHRLIEHGFSEKKIICSSYGMFPNRYDELKKVKQPLRERPVVSFVGSFDNRKGAVEFPMIVKEISSQIPNVEFRLIGTSAMFPTKESVLNYFPNELRKYLKVIPKFNQEDLPELLNCTTVGIFPTYLESFGFGLLEMIAANIPSISYDVPGPNIILPKEYLVKRGDYLEMSSKIISLLESDTNLMHAKKEITEITKEYIWDDLNEVTIRKYEQWLSK